MAERQAEGNVGSKEKMKKTMKKFGQCLGHRPRYHCSPWVVPSRRLEHDGRAGRHLRDHLLYIRYHVSRRRRRRRRHA